MNFQRGDTVSFHYLPSRLTERELWGTSVIKKVIRERQVAVVRVWNGSVTGPYKDQWEDVEIQLSKLFLTKKAPRTKRQ